MVDHFTKGESGATVVYDLRSSKALEEAITKAGAWPKKGRVGHVFMKATLRETKGVFGGELSGHFYFRDSFYTDSGAIAFAAILSVLGQCDKPLSELIAPFKKYPQSGEINFRNEDKDGVLAALEKKYADATIEKLDGVSIELGELNSDAHDAVAVAAGRHCLALGRIECAGRWFAQIEDARLRHEAESYRLFAAGEMEALRAHLSGEADRYDRPAGPWGYREVETAILLALAGETAVADAVIDAFVERGGAPGAEEVARGGLSLLAGDPAEAMPRLTAGVAAMADEGRGIHFVGLDMLSRIAEKRGDLSGAIEFLEMTSRQRDNAILRGSGLFWVKCQTRLADVYRQMDRTEEALRVERELLTALALADAGHPTTVALRGRAT